MQTFKRILCSVLCFVLALGLVSAVICVPYLNSEMDVYMDRNERAELAGSLDTLYIGASQLEYGLNVLQADAATGTYGYNLSSVYQSMYGHKALLEKEISRNPVKHVVLEASYEVLSHDPNTDNAQGDSVVLARLDTLGEQAAYATTYMAVDRWADTWARYMERGITYYKNLVTGRDLQILIPEDKGFATHEANDLTVQDEATVYASEPGIVNAPFREENVGYFKDIVQICKDNNIELTVVVTPLSNAMLTRYAAADWDDFSANLQALCAECDVTCYDFNLLKDYHERFSDTWAYYDINHLSEAGATAFTEAYCEVRNAQVAGEDTSAFFYDSYAEALS